MVSPPETPSRLRAAYDECRRIVEEADADRAVSLAFAPTGSRGDLAALYAFDAETARIRDHVSQPLPGEIRLQWWRDLIAAADRSAEGSPAAKAGSDEETGGSPVASALVATIRAHHLPLDAFDRFIEARIFDLYEDAMPSRGDFEAYAGETASALIMLASMILDRSMAPQASEAAGHAGVAQAVVWSLRLLPLHRSRGQIYLPADLLSAAGCPPEALLAREPEPTSRAVAAMCALARHHFTLYRAARQTLPPVLRAAFLLVEAAGLHLKRIEAGGIAAIEAPVALGPLTRTWTYWRSMRR